MPHTDNENVSSIQEIAATNRVVRSIAHDLGNMLAAIIGGITLIERKLQRGENNPEVLKKYLSASQDGAARALALLQKLIEFSQEKELHIELLNLNELIRDLEEHLRTICGSKIRLEIRPAAISLKAFVDRDELQNALFELMRNSLTAMPNGGSITIRVLANSLGDTLLPTASKSFAVLSVEDTGAGMDAETLNRAASPFFTTKNSGGSYGLGLSGVLKSVTRMGGRLSIDSALSKGTTVNLMLPAEALAT